MQDTRPLAIDASHFDCETLLEEWRWLVPRSETPLMIGAFGDWVFGAPDGGTCMLCLLEGNYERVAGSRAEFNRMKEREEFRNDRFHADWVAIAADRGLVPDPDECLGWKTAPILGGPFRPENPGIFPMRVYQSLQGQLHRQVRENTSADRRAGGGKRPWWRFW